MGSKRSNAWVFVLLGATGACFANAPALMTLKTERFRDSAIIHDDPIAGVTTISTEKGYVEHHGPLQTVWNDEYLLAIVDRKGRRNTFQVIATVTYRGTRRSYGKVRFRGTDGTTTVPTVLMKTTSVNCPTGECTFTDQIEFPVEEALLRQLEAHAADKPELWRFTLMERLGDYTGELSTAEISGLLARVDEYSGAVPPPKVAAAKPGLGLGGLKVEASAQNPSRAGVLVTAVVPGSPADGAGIIVGDIVSELAGHAIEGPADLDSAWAASAADQLTFKIYRGTAQMTLHGHL